MCLGAVYWARLRHIYYANTRAEARAIGFDDDFIYSRRSGSIRRRCSIPATRFAPPGAERAFALWAAKPEQEFRTSLLVIVTFAEQRMSNGIQTTWKKTATNQTCKKGQERDDQG